MLTALTTNVTRFFREPHHFEHLKTHVLAPLLQSKGKAARLRLWSAACSTGQEPYSIAFTLLSIWPEAAGRDVKILATDIDRTVLATAEAGALRARSCSTASASTCAGAFFEPQPGERGRWRVNDEVRRLVVVPAAQPAADLADAGAVSGDLLPQRRHLFRRADAAGRVDASSCPG